MKKKNVKKIRQFLGTNISKTAEAISFNFDMCICKAEIYKFGRNRLSSFGDTKG